MWDYLALTWWRRGITASCLFASFAVTGCSSLMASPQQREQLLQEYLAQPRRLIVYYPSRLQVDEQLRALGMASADERLTQQFHSIPATRGLIERFLSRVPKLSKGSMRIVDPAQLSSMDAPLDTPVLFFYGSWEMRYQRLPPKLNHQRLQLGVIAKIIPLGQVVSGNGTVALHTAAWEGRCLVDAFRGRYFPMKEWLADDASRLRRGIGDSQAVCGEKLANEFLGVAGGRRKDSSDID